jgi:hypothetical protein
MPATVGHVLSATTPDDPSFEIQPQHWNSNHAVTLNIAATEISGLFSNANGVSFGLSDSSITASYTQSTHAHTEYVFSNSNGVSFGTNGSTVTATVKTDYQTSGAYLTTAMQSNAATISNIKVSAGTLSANRSDISFDNSNGISFGLETNGIITGTVKTDYQTSGAYLTTAALSNHSHGNPTLALTNLSGTTASNSAGLTLSLSAANPGGGAGASLSEWCPYPEMSLLTASSLANGSIYFNPVDVPEHLNAYRANFFISVSTQISASNNTKSGSWRLSFCLYSRGTGASTDRLESLLSRSAYISFTASSHTRIQYDHPAGILDSTAVSQSSTSGAATNTSTYGVSSIGGFRVLPFPVSSTLTPGRYWMAVGAFSANANAQGLVNCSVVQQLHGSNIAYMPFGTASKASNASWPHPFPGRGVYSATSAAFPATVAMSTDHIRQLATTVVLPFFNVSGYTTATNQL